MSTSNGTTPDARDLEPGSPEAIEADIERQREQLAATIDQLHAKLDVKTRVKDGVTTADGKPRPDLLVAAVVAGSAPPPSVIAPPLVAIEEPYKSRMLPFWLPSLSASSVTPWPCVVIEPTGVLSSRMEPVVRTVMLPACEPLPVATAPRMRMLLPFCSSSGSLKV